VNLFCRFPPGGEHTVHGQLQFLDKKWLGKIGKAIRFEEFERARREHVAGDKKDFVAGAGLPARTRAS